MIIFNVPTTFDTDCKVAVLHPSLDPDSALRARFCSSNACSSASSCASIAAPRLGLTSPCSSRERPNASPKLPPDCLRKNRCHFESIPSRKSQGVLHIENLIEAHTLWGGTLRAFWVMFLMAANVVSIHNLCNWMEAVRLLLLIVKLGHGWLASSGVRDRSS